MKHPVSDGVGRMNLPTFDYITVKVQPLDERFHELLGKEFAGTITQAETLELDAMCRSKEAEAEQRPASVPVVPIEHLRFLMEGKRA